MSDRLAIVARDVGVSYDLRLTRKRTLRRAVGEWLRPNGDGDRHGDFWALRGITFVVKQGEVLGVIGRNGSGKSTLMLTLAGTLRPDAGLIQTFGYRSTLLTLGAGFEPDLTGRENIFLNAAFLGIPRRQIERRVREIVRFSELGGFIDVPLRKYSSGMRTRLGFSIASHVEPDLLLLDEVLGVGDASFQEKSKARMRELMKRAKAIVIVSHSMAFIRETCTRVLWLDEGGVAGFGDPEDVTARYQAHAQAASGPLRQLD